MQLSDQQKSSQAILGLKHLKTMVRQDPPEQGSDLWLVIRDDNRIFERAGPLAEYGLGQMELCIDLVLITS